MRVLGRCRIGAPDIARRLAKVAARKEERKGVGLVRSYSRGGVLAFGFVNPFCGKG